MRLICPQLERLYMAAHWLFVDCIHAKCVLSDQALFICLNWVLTLKFLTRQWISNSISSMDLLCLSGSTGSLFDRRYTPLRKFRSLTFLFTQFTNLNLIQRHCSIMIRILTMASKVTRSIFFITIWRHWHLILRLTASNLLAVASLWIPGIWFL